MQYFVTDSERKNTVYHEFQKGRFDGQTFWKPDSISLSDDLLFTLGIEKLFYSVIPGYSDTSESEIDCALWEKIMQKAQETGGELLACLSEADAWAQDALREYGVFTVIGV